MLNPREVKLPLFFNRFLDERTAAKIAARPKTLQLGGKFGPPKQVHIGGIGGIQKTTTPEKH